MHHPVVAVALGLDRRDEEPLRVGLGLVAQDVGLGGDDDRARQAAQVALGGRRDVGILVPSAPSSPMYCFQYQCIASRVSR